MERDLVINGHASAAGGRFKKVSVNGRGVVEGDVECDTFDCNGWGVFRGKVKTETLIVNGYAELNDRVEAGKVTVNGKARIGENLTARDVEISGDGKIGGTVTGEEVRIRGRVTIGGDCEAESVQGGGQFRIGGLLNAETIDLDVHGKSQAGEIGGKRIVIRHEKHGWMKMMKTLFPVKLTVETIEGDDVSLEYTSAKVVRGQRVRIGKGCAIDLVEYGETLDVDEGANVKNDRKS
ncbi:MAG TPA: polymer-forming cytoskeletal protein [Bacillales bacterium]|nr:polymer-forming cytoskeletal protein [Bacillales bacterium]